MIVKLHKNTDGRLLLAVCDSEILGKKFVQDGKLLDLTSDFFRGEEMDREKTVNHIRNSFTVNFVGEESVSLGKELGLVDDDCLFVVENIPSANVIVKNNIE